jgi:hypothetical protein
MRWSENSCIYDSIFTLAFEQLGNEFCTLLSQKFEKHRRKEASLEAGRDVICRELGRVNRFFRFGEYTSIEQVREYQTIFSTGEPIYETYYQTGSMLCACDYKCGRTFNKEV